MSRMLNSFCFLVLVIFTVFLLLENCIFEPRDFNKFIIVSISLTLGKVFYCYWSLSKRIVDAKIGKAAFLLPEIETCPLILLGPLIKNLSILILCFS